MVSQWRATREVVIGRKTLLSHVRMKECGRKSQLGARGGRDVPVVKARRNATRHHAEIVEQSNNEGQLSRPNIKQTVDCSKKGLDRPENTRDPPRRDKSGTSPKNGEKTPKAKQF